MIAIRHLSVQENDRISETDDPVSMSLDVDPDNRIFDRLLARFGLIDDAASVFGTATAVPGAGVMLRACTVHTGIFCVARAEVAKIEQANSSAALDNPEVQLPTMRGFKVAHGKVGKKRARQRLSKLPSKRREIPMRVEVRDPGTSHRRRPGHVGAAGQPRVAGCREAPVLRVAHIADPAFRVEPFQQRVHLHARVVHDDDLEVPEGLSQNAPQHLGEHVRPIVARSRSPWGFGPIGPRPGAAEGRRPEGCVVAGVGSGPAGAA